MIYENLLERIMQHYTGSGYDQDVKAAKTEFSDWAGAFDEMSPIFDIRMAQFSDWYIFTRKLNGPGVAPVEYALDDKDFMVSDEERPLLQNVRNCRHSLFEFLKIKGKDVYVRDLISGLKYVIKDSNVTAGFNSAEYFEARLIPFEGGFVFSNSFCFHPAESGKFILKEIKILKKTMGENPDVAKEAFLTKIFQMACRHERYKHLKLKDVYSNDSKIRF